MKQPEKYIKVGVITSAHGVRGEVKIRTFTEDPEDILTCDPLTDEAGKRHFKLTRKGIKDITIIAHIEGVTDRNAAELLRGTTLHTLVDPAQPRKANEWSYSELTGLKAQLPDGKTYGKVTGVYNFGAGDILELETSGGKSEMIPFRNAYVGEIRIEDGYLIVFPPDYIEAQSPAADEPSDEA